MGKTEQAMIETFQRIMQTPVILWTPWDELFMFAVGLVIVVAGFPVFLVIEWLKSKR